MGAVVCERSPLFYIYQGGGVPEKAHEGDNEDWRTKLWFEPKWLRLNTG